jgi:hypothetical protein
MWPLWSGAEKLAGYTSAKPIQQKPSQTIPKLSHNNAKTTPSNPTKQSPKQFQNNPIQTEMDDHADDHANEH